MLCSLAVLSLLALVGPSLGHGDFPTENEIYKKWSMMKAYESCWGEENMKLYTVNMKKAVAKCRQQDAPELDLPPYRSTYRFINTLLTNADAMENKKMQVALRMMDIMKRNEDYETGYNPYSSYYHSSPSYSTYSNNKQEDNAWMEGMMKKMMDMKYRHMEQNSAKTYANFGQREHSDTSFYKKKFPHVEEIIENYGSDNVRPYSMDDSIQYGMYRRPAGDKHAYNPMHEQEDNMFEQRLMDSMQYYKMKQQGRYADKEYNHRFRRNDPNDDLIGVVAASNLPASLDLGDRLAEKLKAEQERMQGYIGNFTCILKEVQVINENNEIDFELQKRSMEQYNFPSEWFKQRVLDSMKVCAQVAEALPEEAHGEFNYPGMVNVGKIKAFMNCCHQSKTKACVYQDVKAKLETNFGPIDKILTQTQMTEDELFPLVIMLLHGEEMEYMGGQF